MPVSESHWIKRCLHKIIRSENSSLVRIVLRNCVRLDGQLSRFRTKYELRNLVQLVIALFIAPTFFVLISVGSIWGFHRYIVPIPFVFEIFKAFHWEEEQWEANIENQLDSMENMADKYEQWGNKRGYNTTTARFLEKTLWHGWPVYLLLSTFMFFSCYLFVIKFCLSRFKIYRENAFLRHENYYNYDLNTIPREKIIY